MRTAAPYPAADLLRASLVIGVPGLAIAGHGGGARSMAFVAVVVIVVRFARAPAAADLVFVFLASADAWLTGLGAFASFNRYDTPGHLLLTAAITPLLFHLALRLRMLRLPTEDGGPHPLFTALAVAAFTIALGTAWELVEWTSDSAFGTNMSLGYTDTLRDLAADVLGAAIGAALAVGSTIVRAPVGRPRPHRRPSASPESVVSNVDTRPSR